MSAPSRGSHLSGGDKRAGPLQHPLQEAESIISGANQFIRQTSNGDILPIVTNIKNGHNSNDVNDGGTCSSSSKMVVDSQENLSVSGKMNFHHKYHSKDFLNSRGA